jgi:hypothetical protein
MSWIQLDTKNEQKRVRILSAKIQLHNSKEKHLRYQIIDT